MNNKDFDYDQIVIGSGFGGSVSALRLSEKGYKVLILEKGFTRRCPLVPTVMELIIGMSVNPSPSAS